MARGVGFRCIANQVMFYLMTDSSVSSSLRLKRITGFATIQTLAKEVCRVTHSASNLCRMTWYETQASCFSTDNLRDVIIKILVPLFGCPLKQLASPNGARS